MTYGVKGRKNFESLKYIFIGNHYDENTMNMKHKLRSTF